MTGMVGWPGDFPDGKRPAGIHPWALVGAPPEHREWNVGSPYVEPHIGAGVLIDAFCTVDAGMIGLPSTTYIGNRTWLQKRVHVGHNARIGVDCEICVGTVICGEVVVGHGVKIGGNSWVKPKVRIGDGAIIGGGSVVTKDVPAHEVWAGNPARYMKKAWTHPDEQPKWECCGAPRHPGIHTAECESRFKLAQRGLEGRERAYAQYDMTADQWEAARAAVGYPSEVELEEWNREAARAGLYRDDNTGRTFTVTKNPYGFGHGHGHGVGGDHA